MLTGSRKLLLVGLFSVAIIVLVNLAWWLFYNKSAELLDHQLERRLSAVASITASSVSTQAVENLSAGGLQAYSEVFSRLEEVRRADSLAEVLILDERYRYLVTTAQHGDSVYLLGELYSEMLDSLLFSLYQGALVTDPYRTGEVVLRSAFAPLIDADGLTVAVLGVEASVDYYDVLSDLRSNLYYSTGLSALVGLVFGLLFVLYQRRVNIAERRLFASETQSFLGRMVAVVSHELKNPLMIIRGSAERIHRRQPSDEATYILEEVDRLNDIVSGYLSFARSGRSLVESEQPQTVDLTGLIASTREHLCQRYPDQRISWLGPDLPEPVTIVGYPRSLRQVLLNLLINGVEACHVAAKPIAVGVNVESTDAEVVLTVIDEGEGLDRSQLKGAFTPFFTTKTSGSGLGLYVSRKLVEEMGGSMDLSSRPGHGTRVKIRLKWDDRS
jgi:signal transduction histidine kinase